MNKTSSNLLFLLAGAAVGAAVGYIAASDKKEQWLNDLNSLVGRIKGNIKPSSQGSTLQNLEDLE